MRPRRACLLLALLLVPAAMPRPAAAWGTEGDMIVALVADRLLQAHDPAVRARIAAILATDKDNSWTRTDIAGEASWADALVDKSQEGRAATAAWHYVELDPARPDFAKACAGHPDLPAMTPAAHGPPQACIIDKIDQFARELSEPRTSPGERLLALRFLLNLTGALHQPLAAIDHGDNAGDCVVVLSPGSRAPVRLDTYWNTTLVVEAEGRDPYTAANQIVAGLTPTEIARWSSGTLEAWARESHDLAKSAVYDFPAGTASARHVAARQALSGSCAAPTVYRVDTAYRERALATVRQQLAKAGVRLAFVLRLNVR
jgi:hypothetical protein